MTQISKIGAFQGTKKTLTNTTVRKFLHNGVLYYCIFKGKVTGTQMTMTTDWEAVVKFDENLSKIEYKTIYSKKDGTKGGAYFLNGEMFKLDKHPFEAEGYTFEKYS